MSLRKSKRFQLRKRSSLTKNLSQEKRMEYRLELGKSNESEIISHFIIEKIISLVITKQYTNKLYGSQLNELCYNYAKSFINSLIKIEYMPHDIDDTESENLKEINSNTSSQNFWNDINEPIRPETDRNCNTLININACLTTKNSLKSIKDLEDTILSNPEEELIKKSSKNKQFVHRQLSNKYQPLLLNRKSSISNKNNMNNLFEKKMSNNKSEMNLLSHRMSRRETNNAFNLINYNENNKIKENSKKININDFSCYDISGNSLFKNDEDEEIKRIRKLSDQMRSDVIHNKAYLNDNNEYVTTRKKNENDTNKNDVKKNDIPLRLSNKFTINLNGEIIKKKVLSPNDLIDEFLEIKSKPKNVGKISKEKAKKKDNTIYKQEDQDDSRKSSFSWTQRLAKKNYLTVKEIEELKDFYKDPRAILKFRASVINNKKKELKDKIPIGVPYEPSGDNFDLIKPSTGVDITNPLTLKKKEGGKGYFQEYNKYSNHDFNNILKETLHLNKKNLMEHSSSTPDMINNNKNNNIELSQTHSFLNKFPQCAFFNSNSVFKNNKNELNNDMIAQYSARNNVINHNNTNNYYNKTNISFFDKGKNNPLSVGKILLSNYADENYEHYSNNLNDKNKNISSLFDNLFDFQSSDTSLLHINDGINNKSINNTKSSFKFTNKNIFNEQNLFRKKIYDNIRQEKDKDSIFYNEKSLNDINLFNLQILKHERIENNIANTKFISNSNSSKKLPIKPDYFSKIKRNGIEISSFKPLRINFQHRHKILK